MGAQHSIRPIYIWIAAVIFLLSPQTQAQLVWSECALKIRSLVVWDEVLIGDASQLRSMSRITFERTVEKLIDTRKEAEAAWLLEMAGEGTRADRILLKLEKELAEMPYDPASFSEKTYGTHGARTAKLKNGRTVLVKPENDDWYASIPKEIGMARFARLLGIPVPPAHFRFIPELKKFASVHYFHGDAVNPPLLERSYRPSEVIFFQKLIGYSGVEISRRNLLKVPLTRGLKKTAVVDLGSAFLDGDTPFAHTVEQFRQSLISERTLNRMKALSLPQLQEELGPFLPTPVIKALYARIQVQITAYSFYNFSTGILDADGLAAFLRTAYKFEKHWIPQKWKWTDAAAPPPFAAIRKAEAFPVASETKH